VQVEERRPLAPGEQVNGLPVDPDDLVLGDHSVILSR
jgi:hypothetical protein